jgi:hypothetical protein
MFIMNAIANEKEKGRNVLQEDVESVTLEFETAVDNYFLTNPPRANEAELELNVKFIPSQDI